MQPAAALTQAQREALFSSLAACAAIQPGDRLDSNSATCAVSLSFRGVFGSAWRTLWSESGEKAVQNLRVVMARLRRFTESAPYVTADEKDLIGWAAGGLRVLALEYEGRKSAVAASFAAMADTLDRIYTSKWPSRPLAPRPADDAPPTAIPKSRSEETLSAIMRQFP